MISNQKIIEQLRKLQLEEIMEVSDMKTNTEKKHLSTCPGHVRNPSVRK